MCGHIAFDKCVTVEVRAADTDGDRLEAYKLAPWLTAKRHGHRAWGELLAAKRFFNFDMASGPAPPTATKSLQA